jgi:hypothetical protein
MLYLETEVYNPHSNLLNVIQVAMEIATMVAKKPDTLLATYTLKKMLL